MAQYRKALEINPGCSQAHGNLGLILAGRGQLDEAIAQYRKALEINPDSMRPLSNLARALEQKGQLTDAVSLLQRALALAKAAGDAAQEKAISANLERLNHVSR